MRREKTVRDAAVDICLRVFRSGSYSDMLLEGQAASGRWSREDLSLLYELVNGSIRRKRTLAHWLASVYHGKWDSLPLRVQWILITALYQIRYLDRIPGFAAVSEAVAMAGDTGNGHFRGTVNAVLRTLIRNPALCSYPEKQDDADYLAIRWSFPDWLVRRLIRETGYEMTAGICEAANRRPAYGVRVRRGRLDTAEAVAAAESLGCRAVPASLLPEFFVTDKSSPVLSSSLFTDGLVSLQDVSAGLASHLLDPKPGETILDAAAAPGGKSTHIAELSGDSCAVLSMDKNLTRLRKVISYRNRLGIKKLFPILGDGATSYPVRAPDGIMVDAPCSGFGVLAKRAELRWHRQEEDIDQLISVQRAMILRAAESLAPGGRLVYSTCTVLPSENEEIVAWLLDLRSDMVVEPAAEYVPPEVVTAAGYIRTWPHVHGCDGVFAARLKKT
ncbi:16S rRNA (cytosine(967)-C(5))-methyltransferase RsmB [bacterium]|nr:16S rRNA (cytosine(967)-C(5))-methyltransferase RsmB [bacterium]